MGNRDRFKGLEWAGKNVKITVGGAGGISSWLVLLLARTGKHTMTVWDFDVVEEHNTGGQLFGSQDVGSTKLQGLARIVEDLSDGVFIPKVQRFTKESAGSPYMFAGFDNMKARADMFEVWKAQEDRELLVDGRLLAETFQIFTCQRGQEEEYAKSLFDDSEVLPADCTARQTSHYAAMIAGMMTAVFTNFLGQDKRHARVTGSLEFIGPVLMLNEEVVV